jgi:multidrug resistance efflux pump
LRRTLKSERVTAREEVDDAAAVAVGASRALDSGRKAAILGLISTACIAALVLPMIWAFGIGQGVAATGVISMTSAIPVAAQIPGSVQMLTGDTVTWVSRGQALAYIHHPNDVLALARAQTQLDVAIADSVREVNDARAAMVGLNFQIGRAELEIYAATAKLRAALVERGLDANAAEYLRSHQFGLNSTIDLLVAEVRRAEIEKQRLEGEVEEKRKLLSLRALGSKVELARISLRERRIELTQSVVRAPISGVLLPSPTDTLSARSIGAGAVLAEIVDTSGIYLVTAYPTSDRLIRAGDSAVVRLRTGRLQARLEFAAAVRAVVVGRRSDSDDRRSAFVYLSLPDSLKLEALHNRALSLERFEVRFRKSPLVLLDLLRRTSGL